MSPKFYLVSLYYDKNRVTGANKRFDEIGRCLMDMGQWDFLVFVTRGNCPDWCPPERARLIRPYHNRLTRLLSWLHLAWMLIQQKRGIIYSDFQPAPLAVDWFHWRYQLIHDLRNWTGFGRGGLGQLTQAFQRQQLRSAKAVVTVSDFSADDIVEKCGIPRDRIIVSYNGVSDIYSPDTSGIRSDDAPDILYIATFEPRKNHLRLIQAIELLQPPCKVVLVGRDLGSREALEAYIHNSDKLQHASIRIIEALDEAELLRLYQSCKLFVSPSLFEGFGMPLIEAAACGATVVCSDIKVFREIMGDNAHYFDPHDVQGMAATIETALTATEKTSANIDRFRWPAITAALFSEMRSRLRSPREAVTV
jgi:glycosyltransferase involved in cell wall biosynthesis